MNTAFFIPLCLGVISVAQGGLNRRIAAQTSLQFATLSNCLVLLGGAVIFYFSTGSMNTGSLPTSTSSRLLLLIPGVLGLTLVAGIPFAIGRWSASFVFVWIIGSQMASGLVWDVLFESKTIHPTQIIGALLSVLGALCFSI